MKQQPAASNSIGVLAWKKDLKIKEDGRHICASKEAIKPKQFNFALTYNKTSRDLDEISWGRILRILIMIRK